MTSISIVMYEELVVFPHSLIKSPGDLLRKVKTEDHSHSTALSAGTPSSANSSMVSDTDPLSKTTRKYYTEISDFNVNFKSLLNSSLASTALDYIIKELNQLPHSFVVSLQIKIVLTDSPSVSDAKHVIRTADLKTDQKAKEQLHYIIFTAFLGKFPKVSSMWAKISSNSFEDNVSEEVREFNEMIREREIERSFFAIMLNKKYSKALNIAKFKELLMELDPVSFTHEWFKEHNRELKKNYRVRFSEDYSNVNNIK